MCVCSGNHTDSKPRSSRARASSSGRDRVLGREHDDAVVHEGLLDRCSIRRVTPPRHVIVCGAGVVGASVAYFLTRRGVAVTVVERTGVACAASGKSGGFLALDWCDGSPLGPLARASFALHAELPRELRGRLRLPRMETFMLAARERGTPAGGHRVAGAPLARRRGHRHRGARLARETTAQVTPARFTAALSTRRGRGSPAPRRRRRGRGVARRRGLRRGDGGRRDARG